MRRRFEIKQYIPVRFDGMTREDTQEQGHGRPYCEKETDEPSGDSESKIDTEDVIDEDEKGQFGQHGSEDIEVGPNRTRLSIDVSDSIHRLLLCTDRRPLDSHCTSPAVNPRYGVQHRTERSAYSSLKRRRHSIPMPRWWYLRRTT